MMSSESAVPSSVLWGDFGLGSISDPGLKPFPYLVTAFLVVLALYNPGSKRSDNSIPILNPRKPFELLQFKTKARFNLIARETVVNWFRANPDKPVRVIADVGEMTILPASLVNEIRNHPDLSFSKFVLGSFHAHLPGFEGFLEGGSDSRLVQNVILKDLTKYLNKVTEPLAEETNMAMKEIYSGSPGTGWRSVHLRQSVLSLVARASSRVFLGDEICRNEDWLKVTREYTIDVMRAVEELRMWPYLTRYIVHWFLPQCSRTRAHLREVRRIITPILDKRREQKAGGEKVEFNDAIEWFEREANGRPYDPAVTQVLLAMAAIHTTTDMVTQVILDLIRHPEMLQPLRDEMIVVIGEGGWKKSSLYNLKLLDSVIKESQRMKPIGLVSMRRIALKDITLSSGLTIPRNSIVAASESRMWDPAFYPDPEKWDGERFLKMRNGPDGKEHVAQLVSTSPEHLGFGHGAHACPGRFFAANEAKVLLVYMLMGYDWRLPEGAKVKTRSFGVSLQADPMVRVEYKKREAEIQL